MADRLSPSTNNVDQIRELMFGPQMREYSARISQLEAGLASLQEGSRRQFDETTENLASELTSAVSASDKKIRALDLKVGEERAEVRAHVEELEEKLTARLDTFETDLTAFREETRKRLEAITESLANLRTESTEVSDKRVQTLASKTQNDVTELRNQAKRTDEKLEFRVQSLNEEIDSSAASLRTDLRQIQKGSKDEIQALKLQLLDELDKRFRELREVKVSRDDMSEILFEFGMRIKGMEMVADVPQLPPAGGGD